jgi:DNA-binding transcriptional ArsR family regulator
MNRLIFAMRDVLYLDRIEQAETLLKPQRIEVLRRLAEPRSCTEVATRLGQTQQRVYYHVKRLVEAGLVTQVSEILELDPGRRMSVAWTDGMVATWELAESGGGTWLTFMQSGFDERRPPYGGWMGWLGGIAELRRFHELSDWRPMWLEVYLEGTPEGLITI